MSAVRRKLRKAENLQCPAYNTPHLKHNERDQGLPSGIHFRPDIDYAKVLVGVADTDADEAWWATEGRCEVPVPQFYVSLQFCRNRMLLTGESLTTLSCQLMAKAHPKINPLVLENLFKLMTDLSSKTSRGSEHIL